MHSFGAHLETLRGPRFSSRAASKLTSILLLVLYLVGCHQGVIIMCIVNGILHSCHLVVLDLQMVRIGQIGHEKAHPSGLVHFGSPGYQNFLERIVKS